MVWAAGDVVHLIEIQEVMKFPGTVTRSIALWMVWAAGDMVHLIEIQEVMKFPGTVTRSIV